MNKIKLLLVIFSILMFLQLNATAVNARERSPEDIIGTWKVIKSKCEGNMWWMPVVFRIKKYEEDVVVFYELYKKKFEGNKWELHKTKKPKEPVSKIYLISGEQYYFEIWLIKAYGIINRVRFYLDLDKGGKKLRGTFIRTVSFPLNQIEKAENTLGSSKILEGSNRAAPDSEGNERELVDIIVGECSIVFRKTD